MVETPINGRVALIPATDDYYDLGVYTRPISTDNPDCQLWFDRGLVWCYAFNFVEGFACFEQAALCDPECVMALWGMAYAAGPNYNKAWGIFDQKELETTMQVSHRASTAAIRLLATSRHTSQESFLVRAIACRYPVDHVAEDYDTIDHAYDAAMYDAYMSFPEDLDVIALYIDAKMMIAQRKMFDAETGREIPSSPVHDIQRLFKQGLSLPGALSHPGLLHYNIHFWEMSARPAVALPAADRLRGLVPDAGHLHHMPSHLDVLVGDYRRAVASNADAVKADDRYLKRNGAKNLYSFYRLHNWHSLVYAATLAGQKQVALDALDPMEASLTEDVLRVESPPLADWLEFFLAIRIHVYVRFGMWDELVALRLPDDKDLYSVTTVMTHYGKGIAYAATGNTSAAEHERELFREAAKRVPPTRLDYPNTIVDVLKVAKAMLDGELEYRKRNFDRAFDSLRLAIREEDKLLYTEPWGWMIPTRHAYGALSLEQGYVEQAAQAFAEDLGLDPTVTRAHQHPNTVWALHGYHECLILLGRDAEARIIAQQLSVAMSVADIEITSSCFCRLSDAGATKNVKESGRCCE